MPAPNQGPIDALKEVGQETLDAVNGTAIKNAIMHMLGITPAAQSQGRDPYAADPAAVAAANKTFLPQAQPQAKPTLRMKLPGR